ncbi:uncharacterized protein LOC107883796 isoform X2 [Acyrthosiphon pisum]|uniref:Uncharacterized protein n=1 Tax=Acyrthosiphon pisum TaxID=7029 RepID=A0A8R2D4R6_ACYPI|nr:uncharacterized protein LOC107883796 isoform X2 [Acyrthosiphon pisum]|eukprot:XP_016659984.1 PREDICTED: uncharacterized protein LOC107883796 isoform X2 [Acyrthosiphon pisum]
MVGIHSHVNQFNVTVNGLETAVEEACENKKIMAQKMELFEYMKNQYYLQMAEDQQNFTEQIRKNKQLEEIYDIIESEKRSRRDK